MPPMRMPAFCRLLSTPANTTNPLFTANRNAAINAGTGQLSASAVSLASVLPGPIGFYPFSGNVYGTPHGDVHVGVGGWMGSVPTAAQDPIFWLHHCNIDRLWNRWLAAAVAVPIRRLPTQSGTIRNSLFLMSSVSKCK